VSARHGYTKFVGIGSWRQEAFAGGLFYSECLMVKG
jgi:hypothetical protein